MADNDFLDDASLKKKILEHIENETFLLTRHAAEEQKNDGMDLQDTLEVLKNGVFNSIIKTYAYVKICGHEEHISSTRIWFVDRKNDKDPTKMGSQGHF